MPDYQKSKIYRLVCSQTGNQYIGSTTQSLSQRKSGHKKKSNSCTSKFLINPEIFLVENCPCNSKEELHKIERSYIESMDCVNKRIPNRTVLEWYQDNKEKIKEKIKEYKRNNTEIIAEKSKKYYQDNKEQAKEYYQDNKERIREREKTKVKCDCGYVVTKKWLPTHKKSTRHINKMHSLQSFQSFI